MSELRLNTDGHIIKFGADNDINITHVADTGLTTNGTFQATTITATTAVVPDASDGAALGTTALEWSDLFLADGAVINFGDDQDVTLTHVADTGILLNSTMQLQFNDSSQFINAPSATVLDINATDEIELNATAVDLNGTLDVSGNSQFSGTITVGVDDTGKDVKLFGATSGSYLEWDESADDLNLIASGIGVTTAKDLGTGIHIRTADSGASVNSNCDELVIEGSGNSGLSILSGASSEGLIFFGDSGSSAIGRLEYNHSTNAMAMTTGGNTAMIIDGNGHVTMPLQSHCQISTNPSADQSDIAVGSYVDVDFDTEVKDLNGDYNTTNYTFTAPVTGNYLVNCWIRLEAMDTASDFYQLRLTTSNRNYDTCTTDPGGLSADQNMVGAFGMSIVIDMDASDTYKATIKQGTGTAQSDISGGNTWQSITLLC